MMEKGSGASSSLVIISRRMLISSVVCTAIFSFGLGYFFGYGGTTTKRVEADNKPAPSEERTVLDASGKPTLVPPPPLPGIVPKEPPLKPAEEQRPFRQQVEPQPPSREMPSPAKQEQAAAVKPQEEAPVKQVEEAQKTQQPQQPEAVRKAPEQAKETKKKAPPKGKAQGPYVVQLGAFSEASKAERMKTELASRGHAASLSPYEAEPGKVLTRVRVGSFSSIKEARSLAERLRAEGWPGVVMPASR